MFNLLAKYDVIVAMDKVTGPQKPTATIGYQLTASDIWLIVVGVVCLLIFVAMLAVILVMREKINKLNNKFNAKCESNSIDSDLSLNSDEQQLLNSYRELDENGKKLLNETANTLLTASNGNTHKK